jgi:hypothetical protein
VFGNQILIDFLNGEDWIDIGIGFTGEFVNLEIFPSGDTGHELDPKEVGQPKDCEALGVSVPVHRMGLDIRFVGKNGSSMNDAS